MREIVGRIVQIDLTIPGDEPCFSKVGADVEVDVKQMPPARGQEITSLRQSQTINQNAVTGFKVLVEERAERVFAKNVEEKSPGLGPRSRVQTVATNRRLDDVAGIDNL